METNQLTVSHLSARSEGTGAANAAYLIHRELLSLGVRSKLWITEEPGDQEEVRRLNHKSFLRRRLQQAESFVDSRLLRRAQSQIDYVISSGFSGQDPFAVIAADNPDVVQLHWIGANSFKFSRLAKINVPIVWRMPDMWAFCGIEHLTEDTRYIEGYKRNNRPKNETGFDVSRWAWENKRRVYDRIKNLTIVTPSRWLASCAQQSVLLRNREIVVIKTGCDIETFQPRDRESCRKVLGLPNDKLLILAGATSLQGRWKGADLLVEAVNKIGDVLPTDLFELVLFGVGGDELKATVPCNVRTFGKVSSKLLMSMLYSAVDVFVAPSRLENLSNAVLESMACATPSVTFAVGGMSDAIDHQVNGYLATPYDTDDLARGMLVVGQRTNSEMSSAARRKIEREFSASGQAVQYRGLYEALLSGKAARVEDYVAIPQVTT